MPTLDWIGKKAVVNHHREVPYRLLKCDREKSFGDPEAGNLLVQGDNLEALKALLPYYAGKVKCIYIDPPYNTGNEGWRYNDNVNSPEIRAWLGKHVLAEGVDLSRHDKWLCMMYPRLRLLKEFLRQDGSVWISIDNNESASLRILGEEIFGRPNFVATVVWQKRTSPEARLQLGDAHEDLLVFAKSIEDVVFNKLPLDESVFSNPDNDPRGRWTSADFTAQGFRPNQMYPIELPVGVIVEPPEGRCWANVEAVFRELKSDNRIWFGRDGKARPRVKKFLTELAGKSAWTWWPNSEAGHSQEGKKESISLFGKDAFETPKPERLIKRIVELSTNYGDLVLDSFAGSGTTAAVAHKMGRQHISVEMHDHAQTHIVPRLGKVIQGEQGGITADVNWQGGGGFRYCTLGAPLFDPEGDIHEAVSFRDLAAHVFFCETGSPIPKQASPAQPLIGVFQGRGIYLLYNRDSAGVASQRAGNVLTLAALNRLPSFEGERVIYAEGCTIPPARMKSAGVVFKQIPYQIGGL